MIRLSIKTPFGQIEVSGESTAEVLEALRAMDPAFMDEASRRVSSILEARARDELKDLVESTAEGPLIVAKSRLSHQAAIGLVLYSSKDQQARPKEIRDRLAASGRRVTVAARLHEMVGQGLIFKLFNAGERAPYYKLSTEGARWIEGEVLPRLRKREALRP